MIPIQITETQLVFAVRVTPRGGRDCVLPFESGDESLKVKVSVPPEDGKANNAVLKLLADCLSLPKRQLSLLSGEKSRLKRILVSLNHPRQADTLLQALANGLNAKPEDCFQIISR